MRRVLRHFFTLCSALSLVLCVAVGVLWVRTECVGSQRLYHRDYMSDGDRVSLVLCADTDMIWFGRYRVSFPKSVEDAAWDAVPEPYRPTYQFFQNHGFMLDWGHYNTPYGAARRFLAALPHWLVIVVTSIAPAFLVRRFRRQRKHAREGRCPTCGYDLRASPDRCPECGTPASPASTAEVKA